MAWQHDKTAQSLKDGLDRLIVGLRAGKAPSDVFPPLREVGLRIIAALKKKTSLPDLHQSPSSATAQTMAMDKEGSEEFQLSLLLHAALFLFLTTWFALRGTGISDRLPKIYPVRLVGPLSEARPGSGIVPRPEMGSRLRTGPARRLSHGEAVAMARVPGHKRIEPVRRRRPVPVPKKVGEIGRAGKPVEKPAATAEPTVTTSAAVVTARPTKPYLAAFETDQVSRFSNEPSSKTTINPTLGGVDLGEQLALAMPDEMKSAQETDHAVPTAGGTGRDTSAPSGASEATEGVGGGEVEIAGLESLGGGAERFEPPRIISKVLPTYPEWARKKGVSGVSVYKVLIQEAGTVGEVVSLSSTVDPRLAILGAQSMRRWVFTPVLVGGEPKPTWVQITVQFKLS
ncbi:MAG: energy transducer TonB [Candidatus Ozemobacteraceae bacterium]